MTKLGDCFPVQQRQQQLEKCLKPFSVFYLDCYFTKPPKEKYLVLVNNRPGIIFFMINSKINAFIQNRPGLLRCQVPLKAIHHSFLNHNSYIHCAECIDNFSLEDVSTQVLSDTSRCKGVIHASNRQMVIDAIIGAETIEEARKREMIKFLKSVLCESESKCFE